MNVLVTGGAGYIGSHTCYALQKAGYTPIIFDDLSTGFEDLVRPFTLVKGSLHDKDLLLHTLKQYAIDSVIHFAAFIAVAESVENPLKYYRNNVTGALCVFEALLESSVQHIIISSTASVYGIPETLAPVDESTPLAPINPYAHSKLMMEQILQDMALSFPQISYAILRYFNAAGADPQLRTGLRSKTPTHIIPRLLMAAMGNIPHFSLYGTDYPTKDGTAIRDYIHVSDLAQAHVLALQYLQKTKENIICNLGTEHGFSNKELLTIVEEVTQQSIPLIYEERRPGDPPCLIADASKAKRLLHWQPHYSDIHSIIKTALHWYIKECTENPS
ncbi:MAG: UDP-glucose 4-epimerase GalE [Desulfovibrionaceae bacterium]